ncbi:hypothetical protein [Paenibacillus kobensis]|uniref:hypothetical protein n=1 Tax=Paenibacillus kobensis TaxID=59841 RepID=UPI000FDC4FF8|nr:hypothetical protein [Paenibacillus kobensis]
MAPVHDYEVISYEVNLKDRIIIINTEYNENKLKIEFTDVLAHLFEDQLQGSVLLDIDTYDIEGFVEGNVELLERHKPYCWPTSYETLNELRGMLVKEQYEYFVICSSIGFNGWVLAKKMKIVKRDS